MSQFKEYDIRFETEFDEEALQVIFSLYNETFKDLVNK